MQIAIMFNQICSANSLGRRFLCLYMYCFVTSNSPKNPTNDCKTHAYLRYSVLLVCCPVQYFWQFHLYMLYITMITRYKFFPRNNHRSWTSWWNPTTDTNISGICGCYLQIRRFRVFKNTCRAQRNWRHIKSEWSKDLNSWKCK